MSTYRITYVNVAFAPRASYACVQAENVADAIAEFRKNTRPAILVASAGDRGIVRVERLHDTRGGALCN